MINEEEVKPPRKHTLGELRIDIGDGWVAITEEAQIEFHDCLPIAISELGYIWKEAKYYISYRNYRIADRLIDEFPEHPEPHIQPDRFPKQCDPVPAAKSLPKKDEPLMSARYVMLVSTWGIKCGIATYTEYLYNAINKIDNQFLLGVHPISEGVDDIVGRVVHYQHEFGIMPEIPKGQSNVIITFHSVPENISSILAAYEKNLNVVAYVVHFQESKDIISANTKKDVWLIPHGTKIIPGANKESESADCIKNCARILLDIPIDEPHAFMFGFQSDNKNYTMVTQACEKAGIKLIISGAVNDHANYKGNIGCGRDNVVLGRYLSEIEVDLYALASDLLLFQTNPIEHYSCSGALHRVIGAGKPIICNRVNHYSDLFEDEDCLKYDSEEELVEKIKEALEKKEEFGRKALEYAERTSWEIVAKKHMEMYKKYGGI